MERSEIEECVREWIDRGSVDANTGVPPDAKVSVRASYVTTIGHLNPGQDRPDHGLASWLVTATVYFPETSSSWDVPNDVGLVIAKLLDRLRESLDSDPSIGTVDPEVRVEWRGTDGSTATERWDAPSGYPRAVEIHLAATYWS